jgi:tetratricopeptide (TPR) repeat protein
MKRVFIFLTVVCILGCKQKAAQTAQIHRTYKPEAVKLNDSAVKVASEVTQTPRPQVLTTAISLLNQATSIDTSYYTAYWNKRAYQIEARQYTDALATGRQMIKLSPNNADDYTCQGMISEMALDSVNALKYFNNAIIAYNRILDTMDISNSKYKPMQLGKAMDLIMVNQRTNGNAIFKKLQDDSQGIFEKKSYKKYINLSKNGIVNNYVPGKYDE